jgi:uncharacterized integral membrane protein
MDVSCHRPFLPGTSLEPAVIPTAQASNFTLQYIIIIIIIIIITAIILFCFFAPVQVEYFF